MEDKCNALFRASYIELFTLQVFLLQSDLRTLSTVYGSFGDVFEDSSREQEEEQIIQLVRDVEDKTLNRFEREFKLLPYRS